MNDSNYDAISYRFWDIGTQTRDPHPHSYLVPPKFKCQTYHDETRSVELHFSEDRMILRLIAFPQ